MPLPAWLQPVARALGQDVPAPARQLAVHVLHKAAPASRQIPDAFDALYQAGRALEPPLPPERLLMLAEENAVHAACLRAKADDAVGRGWQLVGDQAEAADAVAERLAALTPQWTFAELLAAAAWELEAIGWAAWEVVRDGGQLAALYPLPAHTLRLVARGEPAEQYVQVRGVEQRTFAAFGAPHPPDRSEVILFRAYTPRSTYYGLPRWISAIPAIAELTAIREYNVAWYESGGTLDRLIHVAAPSAAEARQLKDEIAAALRDAAGRGHVSLVLASTQDTGVQVQFLAPQVGAREGQFIRRREDLVKEILMAHGVPPYRIGWAELGSLGGSAAREMLRAYRIGVIEPIQTILEARLQQTLFGPQGLALRGQWRLNDLDWEETELNLKLATEGIAHGMLTPNEARQLLGRAPADEPALDRHYLGERIHPLGEEPEVQRAVDVLHEVRQALLAAVGPEADGAEAPNGHVSPGA